MTEKPLTDHVILITGAGGGLGGTAAVALAGAGAQVILLDKNLPKLETVYDAIKSADFPEPILYPFDLAGASEQDYIELADRVGAKYGCLHGLLHSAVEFRGFTPIALHDTKEWVNTLNVNLNAPFVLCRMLLPLLQKAEQASIVFTSDSSARSSQAYSGAYGISKIAIEAMAKILAAELQSFNKIRVNTLIPGPVNSPVRKRGFPAEGASALPPSDTLTPVYRYLFSAASIGVTGRTIDARTFQL